MTVIKNWVNLKLNKNKICKRKKWGNAKENARLYEIADGNSRKPTAYVI